MKALFPSLLTGIAIITFTACDDNGVDVAPAPVAGVSNLQFDVLNDEAKANEDGTASIYLHVYKQSLHDDQKTVVFDSTFTLNLSEAPEKISIVKSIDIVDVRKEVVVSCGSISFSDGGGVSQCSYADHDGRLVKTELEL